MLLKPLLKKPLKNKKILITAGPTREYLDPVRFLSNDSSGEMGLTVAEALSRYGADVTVVLGPTSFKIPASVRIVRVVTAMDMSVVVKKLLPDQDVFIATAAVSDYRFEKSSPQKIKKSTLSLSFRLVKNPDILKEAGEWKRKNIQALSKSPSPRHALGRGPGVYKKLKPESRIGNFLDDGTVTKPILIGYALETKNLEAYAQKKLHEKNCDVMIGNSPASFSSPTIQGVWLEKNGVKKNFSKMTKKKLSQRIAQWLITTCNS